MFYVFGISRGKVKYLKILRGWGGRRGVQKMTSIPVFFFWNSPVMLRQRGSNIRGSIIVTYIITHAPTFVPKASSTSCAYIKKIQEKKL